MSFFTTKSFMIFLMWLFVDIIAGITLMFIIQRYVNESTKKEFNLLLNLIAITPLLLAFFVHFAWFYILSILFFKEIRERLMNVARSWIGIELLLIQLIVAVYLGATYDLVNANNKYLAPIIWAIYPIVIGSIKGIQMKVVSIFNVEQIYEFLSLNLAAFPYRFLYLGVDSYLLASMIIIT